jgi:hypothetical protein
MAFNVLTNRSSRRYKLLERTVKPGADLTPRRETCVNTDIDRFHDKGYYVTYRFYSTNSPPSLEADRGIRCITIRPGD